MSQRSEKAGVLVRPITTAPARRQFATTGLSCILIAIGATLCGLLLDLPQVMRWVLIGSGVVTGVIAIALPVLVFRGLLTTAVGLGRTLRVNGESAEVIGVPSLQTRSSRSVNV